MKFSFEPRGVSGPSIFIVAFFALLVFPSIFASPTQNDNDIEIRRFGPVGTRRLVEIRREMYEGMPTGKNGTGGPTISDYPNDDDIRINYMKPNGSSVFFSGIPEINGSSTVAYNFAQRVNGVIFRGVYPRKYTTKNGRSVEWYQDFADRFSGVYAEEAVGDAYLVAPYNRAIEPCRVWTRIERPTLEANSNINRIILVDWTDFTNNKTIYTRFIGFSDQQEPESESLATSEPSCFDWDGYGDDPNDPDSGGDPDYVAYAAGQCGVHITQYQKNEGPGDNTANYRFDVFLYDANGQEIGEANLLGIPSGSTASVDSALPYTFDVTAGNVDSDAVLMAYAGQSWSSNDQAHQCNFGAYDSGNRDGDCSFTC